MIPYLIGAVLLVFLVAGYFLSEDGRVGGRRSGMFSNLGGGLLALIVLVFVWGGGVAEFVGCVCIVLKLLGVAPVASWAWMQVLLPLIVGFVAQVVGVVANEATR